MSAVHPMNRIAFEVWAPSLVAGVRNAHQQGLKLMPSQIEQMNIDWRAVIVAVRELQQRMAGHPQIQYFTISRDEQEVSVKMRDATPRGTYLIFARHNPDQPGATQDRVWLSELGKPSASFGDAVQAFSTFLQQIAGRLG